MKVIDKILNEWSFRCHDGIVDMNDPKKVVILNEILANYNLDEQDEQNVESLEKILLSKNIPYQQTDYIILKTEKLNQVEDLYNLIDSISLNELRGKDTTLRVGNLSWLNDIIGVTSKSLTLGKGEILLVLMIKNAKLDLSNDKKNKDTKADINVSGRKVEIKQSSETGGAIISRSGRSGGYATTWTKEFKDKWKFTKALSTWTPIYEKFISLSTKEERNEFINDINNLITVDDKFDPLPSPSEIPQNSPEKFYKLIASLAIKDYLVNKDVVLMNQDLDYTIINDKQQIIDNPNIRPNSAYIPRIFYKEVPVNEMTDNKLTEELTNSLLELLDTDHFQLRLSERGNVLDILNLEKIPLKDYKLTDVKEKLKINISEKVAQRASNILDKNIPSSVTYDVGIKILKPILVVDGTKYPLRLFAKSTKEIKDKDGNVKEVIQVDNKGTLYFATVADNKATTLLLLDKEDDNELYFQIKDHIDRKKGGNKEAKILPSDYVYEIDLDELMGKEKEPQQGPTLTDPSTLPYKLRTDYRADANFEHKEFGIGKIVTTSAGSGGKGDSRGIVDWIDVKYPKPFVKSGKVTNIRRFNNIITLASPLLAK